MNINFLKNNDMKILQHIYILLLLSLFATGYAQESRSEITKLNGILKLKEAEIDQQTNENLYYTVVEVKIPGDVNIQKIAASTAIRVDNNWRETFNFYEKEGIRKPGLKYFYVEGNILRFEMGILPEKYKIRVILYESQSKKYHVNLSKTKI